MRPTWVSISWECDPSGLRRWGMCGGKWCRLVFRDWAHRCCNKAQPFPLSCLPQRRVCAHTRSPWNFAALSGEERFSSRPTFEVMDAMLGSARLRGQPTEPCRAGTATRPHCESSMVVLVVQDREYHFSEDVIVDEFGALDPSLAVMAEVSPLIKVLRLRRHYELVSQLWAQFTLSAG